MPDIYQPEIAAACERLRGYGVDASAACSSMPLCLRNPSVKSYQRFRPETLAPWLIDWGLNNRSATLGMLAERGPATRTITSARKCSPSARGTLSTRLMPSRFSPKCSAATSSRQFVIPHATRLTGSSATSPTGRSASSPSTSNGHATKRCTTIKEA
jgi:hypothetical protein